VVQLVDGKEATVGDWVMVWFEAVMGLLERLVQIV
jgi:hypothetical protein